MLSRLLLVAQNLWNIIYALFMSLCVLSVVSDSVGRYLAPCNVEEVNCRVYCYALTSSLLIVSRGCSFTRSKQKLLGFLCGDFPLFLKIRDNRCVKTQQMI